MVDKNKLAQLFDHTNLKSYATARDIDVLCAEAAMYNFATVCVYGYWVDYIRETYPDIRVCQVLNFPTGLSLSDMVTLSEINSDATEYDIVMNISKFKEGRREEVCESLRLVRSYTRGKVLKVIVESGVLTTEELVAATDMVSSVGADFIKTSTGFISQEDSRLIEQVAIISNIVKAHHLPIEIKASGGVKSLDLVRVLIGLGVTRFGSSSSTRIIRELEGGQL